VSFDLQILNGDLVVGSNGDFAAITGKQKLIQDLLKIALTTAGSNPLQPWYGSLISKTLIGSFLQSDITITMAKTQLQNCIENLKNLQALQVSSGQKMTPDEQIAFISNISVNRNTIDPRIFSVSISVLDKAYGKANASFTMSNI
jgi:hypothetical protein